MSREARAEQQQFVRDHQALLARWLLLHPKLFILDEPTRGIDVGAKMEIERLLGRLRDEGISILLISSELDEVVRNVDLAVVLRDREQIGQLLIISSGTTHDVREDSVDGAAAFCPCRNTQLSLLLKPIPAKPTW